jgi:hypothetical protein
VLNDLGIGDELGVEERRTTTTTSPLANEPPPPQADNSEGDEEMEDQSPADMEMIEGDVDTENDRTSRSRAMSTRTISRIPRG